MNVVFPVFCLHLLRDYLGKEMSLLLLQYT